MASLEGVPLLGIYRIDPISNTIHIRMRFSDSTKGISDKFSPQNPRFET